MVFDAGRVTSWTLASTWTHNLFFWESVGRGWVKLVVGLVLFPEMVQACRHQQIWTFWLCLQTVYQPPITSLPSGFPDYETHIVLQHVFHQVRVGMGYHQHTLQRMRPYFRVHCWYQACSGATLSCPECSLLISTNSNAWMCCVTFVRIVTWASCHLKKWQHQIPKKISWGSMPPDSPSFCVHTNSAIRVIVLIRWTNATPSPLRTDSPLIPPASSPHLCRNVTWDGFWCYFWDPKHHYYNPCFSPGFTSRLDAWR